MISVLLPAGILALLGLLVLSGISSSLFLLQLVWIFVGILFVVACLFFDWREVFHHPWAIYGLYGFVMLLLLIAAFLSPSIRNTRSWIAFGPIRFEPIEAMKIALILVYAQYFSRRHLSVARLKNIATSFLLFAVPGGTVAFLQHDLGSALVLFSIWFGFLLVSGLPVKHTLAAIAIFAIGGVVLWRFGLEAYQKDRILGVIYPQTNALTVNYSTIQSKIAIGSAGFWGKGYGQGLQTQLGFLPEPVSDFILAALVEEWGFAGGMLALTTFFLFVYGLLRTGLRARRNFEKFVCLGISIMFATQFFLNAGSALGISPVVGITFPFLSYGGSSMLADAFLLAIANAIARESRENIGAPVFTG